ncbi:hypothetical protein SESBI_11751 [Sesbania bispinosa]|nr:hypothetical protein SESBI_11751 [Sesbania bispinosa]
MARCNQKLMVGLCKGSDRSRNGCKRYIRAHLFCCLLCKEHGQLYYFHGWSRGSHNGGAGREDTPDLNCQSFSNQSRGSAQSLEEETTRMTPPLSLATTAATPIFYRLLKEASQLNFTDWGGGGLQAEEVTSFQV